MPAKLFYVGSPLLDITCTCDAQFLQKYSLKPDDCIRTKKDKLHNELFSEVFKNPSATFTAGGSSQNSARVSKWVLRNDSEARVWFAGCVGNDPYAEVMENVLMEDGVESCYTRHESIPTGVCACLIGDTDKRYLSTSQRSMVTDLGAAATCCSRHLDVPETRKIMEEADLMFVSGFFLFHSLDVVQYLAEYCHSNNKLFSTSLSAVYICECYTKELLEWLPYVDLIFGNLEEAQALLKQMEPNNMNTDAKTCSKVIADYPKANNDQPRIVIISSGIKPVTVTCTNQTPEEFEVPVVDNIVDTVGCGDALAGGFLAEYVSKRCIKSAVRTGIDCARRIAQISGCTLPEQ